MDITVEKLRNGGHLLSAIVDGYLVTRRYYGYTVNHAVALFHEELA